MTPPCSVLSFMQSTFNMLKVKLKEKKNFDSELY